MTSDLGRQGRAFHSLTLPKALDVLTWTEPDPLHPYIVISLLTGARTEELRALRWENVRTDTAPEHSEVWRSVRATGETKTRKSRRTLALPSLCIDVPQAQRGRQMQGRLSADSAWVDSGLVFTASNGTQVDAANVRRGFRRALAMVPGVKPADWTPRDLRHSFVSLLCDAGVPIEGISRLVGHSGTAVTDSGLPSRAAAGDSNRRDGDESTVLALGRGA